MKFFSRKRPDLFDYEVTRECLNCGNSFRGKFCSRCGEKVVDQRERSIRHFLGEVLNAFTFLDGKFPRSLKMILISPGKLSFDVVRGVRMPYMRPVSLFFLANFLYFLLPLTEAFNTSLHSQLTGQWHSEIAKGIMEAKITAQNITYTEFETMYNNVSSSRAKLLLIVLVFLFSLVLSIVNFSKRRYYADHLTVSFEFMSFTLLYVSIIIMVMLIVVMAAIEKFKPDLMWLFQREHFVILPLTLASLFYFLWRMQIRFYKNRWWVGFLKAAFVLVGFMFMIVLYRFMLFFVTFWSV